jgi:hypothetical protein
MGFRRLTLTKQPPTSSRICIYWRPSQGFLRNQDKRLGSYEFAFVLGKIGSVEQGFRTQVNIHLRITSPLPALLSHHRPQVIDGGTFPQAGKDGLDVRITGLVVPAGFLV